MCLLCTSGPTAGQKALPVEWWILLQLTNMATNIKTTIILAMILLYNRPARILISIEGKTHSNKLCFRPCCLHQKQRRILFWKQTKQNVPTPQPRFEYCYLPVLYRWRLVKLSSTVLSKVLAEAPWWEKWVLQ